MEKNNLKEEEWNTYECEVYLSHCSCITKYVKAPTLEAAIAYLEKKYPKAPLRWWRVQSSSYRFCTSASRLKALVVG